MFKAALNKRGGQGMDRQTKRHATRKNDLFIGAWCSPITKRKLQALALLSGKSQSAVLVHLVDAAPIALDVAGENRDEAVCHA